MNGNSRERKDMKTFNLIQIKLTWNEDLINHAYMPMYRYASYIHAHTYNFSLKLVPNSLNRSSFPLTPVGLKDVLKNFSEVGGF